MSGTNTGEGLQIAQKFCQKWVLPFLETEFPDLHDRSACVLFGGSQSLGNDDVLSRDHGWGPAFELFLTNADARQYGRQLQRALNEAAPRNWQGAEWRELHPNVSVRAIDTWMRQHMRYPHPPKTRLAWLRMCESQLYMMRHCTVFHDPLGEFSRRKEAYHYYPRDVWLQRVWDETFSVWHYGEYNFIDRMVHRGDRVTISVCLGAFSESAMRLCLLLNEDYTPYWKWLATEFRKLPDIEELDRNLDGLMTNCDLSVQAGHVKTICRDIFMRLTAKGLVHGDLDADEHCLKIAKRDLRRLMDDKGLPVESWSISAVMPGARRVPDNLFE